MIRPLVLFNISKRFIFINESEWSTIQNLRTAREGQIVRYFGVINQSLIFFHIMLRFYLLTKHIVIFYFKKKMKMTRVMTILGGRFDLQSMIRSIYYEQSTTSTLLLLIVSLLCLINLYYDFEAKILNIKLGLETFYFMIVTMTTVGFGDFYPESFFGRHATIIANFLGVVFEALFLLSWKYYTTFDHQEMQAYTLISRLTMKESLQQLVIQKVVWTWKIKKLNKTLRKLQRDHPEDHGRIADTNKELFYFAKDLKGIDAMFHETKIKYEASLLSDSFRKANFSATVFNMSSLIT